MTNLIDLRGIRELAAGDLASLQGYLLQLEGQPFLFPRITYGDELSLHFGAPREFDNPRISRKLHGSYVLTTRASAWRLHSMPGGCLIHAGTLPFLPTTPAQKPIGLQDLERMTLITPGSRVISADIQGFRLPWGIELGLTFSDGSAFFITPMPPETPSLADEALPDIADWELFTPHRRVLLVGPGYKWEYADTGSETPDVSKSA